MNTRQIRLAVFSIPNKRPVAAVAGVLLVVTHDMLLQLERQYSQGFGMGERGLGRSHQMRETRIMAHQPPVWVDAQGRAVRMDWSAPGKDEHLFISKAGDIHLLNMVDKQLVRTENYPLARLKEDFGEDSTELWRLENTLRPTQVQGALHLM